MEGGCDAGGQGEDGTETVASLDRLRALYTRKARTCLAHPFPLACVTFPSPANFFVFFLCSRARTSKEGARARNGAPLAGTLIESAFPSRIARRPDGVLDYVCARWHDRLRSARRPQPGGPPAQGRAGDSV